jgi:ketosteroid isomerase-like protein
MNMKNKILIQFILLILSFNLANSQDNLENVKEAMKKTDIEFSDYSKLHGFKQAFFKYMTEDAVILKDNSYPVEGGNKIRELFADDGGYTLVWIPTFAAISSSADLGYTYGLYELTVIDDKGVITVNKGTYLTIWKLQPNGEWKFVFDTGHKGLEPPKK